ncbi:hypothetical protein SCLCIDRAFT_75584, partial [Scleroderma citrinum Foug A]
KRQNVEDLLMIFTDKVTVKFTQVDGRTDTLRGRWCKECKEDAAFVKLHGKRKAFFTGGNSTCRQHIRVHYKVYKERCSAENIKENHHAIP